MACGRQGARRRQADRSRSRPASRRNRAAAARSHTGRSPATTRSSRRCASATASCNRADPRRHGGDRARLPGRPAAERPARRLRRPPRAAPSISFTTTSKRGRRHARSSADADERAHPAAVSCRTNSCRRIRSMPAFPRRRCQCRGHVRSPWRADPNVDMLAWAGTLPTGKTPRDVGEIAPDRLSSRPTSRSSASCRMQYHYGPKSVARIPGRKAGFPVPAGPAADDLRAMHALAVLRRARRAPHRAAPPAPARPISKSSAAPPSRRRSPRHGLTPPRERAVATPAEAARRGGRDRLSGRAENRLARHPHKTEVGGVRLDLRSRRRSRDAADALSPPRRAGRMPRARIEGFLVQEMVARRRDDRRRAQRSALRAVVVGRRRRRSGRARRDVAFRLLPVGEADVARHARGAAARAAPRRLSRAAAARPRGARARRAAALSRNSISITAPASPISRSIR